MKAVGCVVLVGVVVVGGFFALAAYFLVRGDDQSALTQPVQGVAIEPREFGSGTNSEWHFDYAYEVEGQWYGDDGGKLGNRYWSPGSPVDVCVDPEDPRRHVLQRTGTCGEENISGNYIQEAKPRDAP